MRNVISVLSSTSGTPLPGFPLRRLPVAAATPLLLSVEVVPPQRTIEDLIRILEITFEIDNIKGDVRKKKALLTQLTPELATTVTRELRDADVTYEAITDVLLAKSVHTTVAAWEAL